MDKHDDTLFQHKMSKALDLPEVRLNSPPFPEITLNTLTDILSLTIKHDDLCKTVTFLGMLSAYTYDSQLNISFNAPSSSGKTYITSEVAKLFPTEDKIEISGASPTALFYQQGEVDKDTGARNLVLENKILIFYELPDQKVQERLRAIASHDNRTQTHFYTNKSKSGANRTDKIVIIGFPSMVFCSASLRINEQEQTREFLLSPEQSQEKIAAAIELQNKRGNDEQSYYESLANNLARRELMERIVAIRDERVRYIKLPDTNEFKERFLQSFKQLKERHTRDFTHVQQLAKAIALLNVWHRRQPDGSCVAKPEDVELAMELWEKISESQVLGIPPTVLHFYQEYILGLHAQIRQQRQNSTEIGFSHSELANYYLQKTNTLLNDDTLRKQIIPQLFASGLIDRRKPDIGDKRSHLIYPKWKIEN